MPGPAGGQGHPVDRACVLPPTGDLVAGVRRVAVLRANSIGDFVLVLPALEALRAAYPDAEITILGREFHAAWLSGRPGPWDRVTAVPAYPGVTAAADAAVDTPEIADFLAEQRAQAYDLALQLHGGGAHSNPFVARLGARVTVGSRDDGAPALDRAVAYTPHQHEVLRYLEVVGLVGAAPVVLEPRLAVTPADRAEARTAVPPSATPLVAVHPGANDARRRWPSDRFAAVADDLAGGGADVVLIGTPLEAALTAAVAGAMRAPAVDLAGRLSLVGTTGLLARCVLLVGNDSGPRHIAAAVGTATVGVYWAANLASFGPMTRARHRVAVSFRTVCPVCGIDSNCERCPHEVSFLAAVPTEQVRRAAEQLFVAEVATRSRTD